MSAYVPRQRNFDGRQRIWQLYAAALTIPDPPTQPETLLSYIARTYAVSKVQHSSKLALSGPLVVNQDLETVAADARRFGWQQTAQTTWSGATGALQVRDGHIYFLLDAPDTTLPKETML